MWPLVNEDGDGEASQEEFDFDKDAKVGAEVDITVSHFVLITLA